MERERVEKKGEKKEAEEGRGRKTKIERRTTGKWRRKIKGKIIKNERKRAKGRKKEWRGKGGRRRDKST